MCQLYRAGSSVEIRVPNRNLSNYAVDGNVCWAQASLDVVNYLLLRETVKEHRAGRSMHSMGVSKCFSNGSSALECINSD